MNGSALLTAAVSGFLLAAAATHMLRRVALRWEFTDRPGGHKSHERPTPYLGGVAIALGTIVPPVALVGLPDERVAGIIVGALVLALLGLIDDLRSLRPLTRLTVETLAAVGVVLTGVRATVTGTWLDVPITVLWIVVITNSFNLLDNMDGALAAVTVVSAAILAAAAFVSARPVAGLILVTLPLSVLGFLPYNWVPAKIFMGDAGSLFIGFVLACSAALLITGRDTGTAIAGLLLPTFVATVDTGVVVLSRRRAGLPIMQGGTDHLSHRLCRLGLSRSLAALALAALAATTGMLHLVMTLRWISSLTASLIGLGSACILIGLPQRVRVYPSVQPRKTPTGKR
ncbi:glycosyltransferase family 4 protein [Sphaerimonospora thailandensis]|uniref:Undecaprenyl-phosphate alpha-N-acetylglucosaminyl 1-phosphate transferase n=1 Tax=Sphaerimonospora thailandensis TaxID=795644 RepID=A0A8J3RCL9_9ACTN|nr:MraY family glycosyltransferase [Sphaerimonospora thailandensis]GIH71412.1 undecaprenyl-phosphate alpha-N-acetylglucosaminyl 1-phosphate transferase [Sphaerimonospora thailandensis]